MEVLGHYSKQRDPGITGLEDVRRAIALELGRLEIATQAEIRNRRRQPARARRLRDDEVQRAIKAYEQGSSTHQIGLALGVHRETVAALLRRNGFELRANVRIELDEEQQADVLAVFEKLGTVLATARATGHSERVIARTLDEAGMVRSRQQAR